MRSAAVVFVVTAAVLVSSCRRRHRPDTPAVPSGPCSGVVDVSYKYVVSATDPDGDSVAIRFDWGDGDTSDWSALVYPEDWVVRNHSWSSPGTFRVAAQARCADSTVSAWSDALQVQIGPVVLRWVKTFGGAEPDRGGSAQEVQGGGYIVTGHSGSFGAGGLDAWLVRTDPNGDTVWTRTFGGAGWDEGSMVQETRDGGFILTGQTASSGAGQTDLWLVKTDAQGNLVWDRTFGGVDYDGGYSVQETRDSGYVASGYIWSNGAGHGDGWLIKTDAGGNPVWVKTYGGTDEDWGQAVQQTQDGGYVIAGVTYSSGSGFGDVWLVKTDATGNKVWDKAYGGAGEDWAYSVRQTLGGGYIVAGYTESYGAGGRDVWLVRTDADGNMVWDKTHGGAKADVAASVQLTSDGGYILVGYTESYGAGGRDVWLIRTGRNGDTLWTRTFGGADDDEGCSAQRTEDGGYIIVGTTESYGAGGDDVWLIKTDAEGRVDEEQGK